MKSLPETTFRLLVIDDTRAIHEDFKKILRRNGAARQSLAQSETTLFGKKSLEALSYQFQIDSAFQGRDGIELVEKSLQQKNPYSLVFVDVRMPPGLDGVDTTAEILAKDPDLQVVICTAFSDYSWDEMTERLGISDRLVILKKPFDNVEVIQLTHAMVEKWRLRQKDRLHVEQLEAIVAERTRELQGANEKLKFEVAERARTEETLRQAQKMEALGQLAGGVAHDFNNLLTVIRGYTDCLLSESKEAAESFKELSEIRHAADRAARLTSQMLTFCRKKPLQRHNTDLGDLISRLGDLLRRLLGENINVELQSAGQPLIVHADPGMMEQVILNLAVNARDAMPKGGTLTIRAEKVDITPKSNNDRHEARCGQFVRINVSDTGTGIAPEVLPHLFEPFFTTKEPGKGTGMGLATVYGIVQQHQGWIEVESNPGNGASFAVFLPAKVTVACAVNGAEHLPKLSNGTETILLVEDEDLVRQLAEKVLHNFGYRVYNAGSGPEALTIWNAHRGEIDLLLTDMMLPGGMSGHDLAQDLQRQKEGLKVAYTTGYSAEAIDPDYNLQEGVNFLPKPYSPDGLGRLVRHCLDDSDHE